MKWIHNTGLNRAALRYKNTKYKIILFSVEGAGPDFVLHGDELAAPDHNVPAVPAHHRGLRLYPPGLRLV